MNNLKEALTRILRAVETGMKAYADEKINTAEWIGIGTKIIAWIEPGTPDAYNGWTYVRDV